MRFTLLLASLLFLASCATPHAYNPKNLEKTELATLKRERVKYGGFIARIHKIYANDNTPIVKSSWLEGGIDSIDLAPGSYSFLFECSNGSAFSKPTVRAALEPGKTYIFFCQKSFKKKKLLGIHMLKAARALIMEANEFEKFKQENKDYNLIK